MSPAEAVVYWTDYVIRHKGAPHLKSQALKLSWYQHFLFDVMAVISFLTFVLLFVLYKLNRIVIQIFIKIVR